eukprot:5912916-Amphidinium_carterae.1
MHKGPPQQLAFHVLFKAASAPELTRETVCNRTSHPPNATTPRPNVNSSINLWPKIQNGPYTKSSIDFFSSGETELDAARTSCDQNPFPIEGNIGFALLKADVQDQPWYSD